MVLILYFSVVTIGKSIIFGHKILAMAHRKRPNDTKCEAGRGLVGGWIRGVPALLEFARGPPSHCTHRRQFSSEQVDRGGRETE